jgi:hypothetical protein
MVLILELLVYAAVGYSEWLGTIIFVGLNTTFALLDVSELKAKGRDPEGWMWLGLLFVPVYMFIRAAKIGKKYGYAITWCVAFALYLII